MPVKIDSSIQAILRSCRVEGDKVYLPPGQLDRKTYEAVNKALSAIGGKWTGGKVKAHVFPRDVSQDFQAMVEAGEYIDAKKDFSFFPTPEAIVRRMIALSGVMGKEPQERCSATGKGWKVLEPSAGAGAIYELLPTWVSATLVELDPGRARELEQRVAFMGDVFQADFLTWEAAEEYDLVLMNPPFNKHDEDEHVRRAFGFLRAGGILVTILPEGWFFREGRKEKAFREFLNQHRTHEEKVSAGGFKSSGTEIPTRIVVLKKPFKTTHEGEPMPSKSKSKTTKASSPPKVTKPKPAPGRKPFPSPGTKGRHGIEDLAQKKTSVYHIAPHRIRIEEGYNLRTDYGDLAPLAEDIREHGVHTPLKVVRRGTEYWARTGHRRLAAIRLLLRNHNIRPTTVPVEVVPDLKEAEEVFRQLSLDHAKELTQAEQGEAYRRIVGFGNKVSAIAKRTGRSVAYIEGCMEKAAHPELPESMSATAAAKLAKATPSGRAQAIKSGAKTVAEVERDTKGAAKPVGKVVLRKTYQAWTGAAANRALSDEQRGFLRGLEFVMGKEPALELGD